MISYIRSILITLFRPYLRGTSTTVRFAFPMLAVIAALLGAGAVSTSQQSSIRLESATASVSAGEPFSVQVYVAAHVPVNAVNLEVSVPKNVTVRGIDTGESVITLWTKEPYLKNDTLYLQGGTYRKGFVGEHLIATINAEASETGLAEFKVTNALLLAGDGSGSKVTLNKEMTGAKLFIANADGTYTTSQDVGVTGAVAVVVVTDIDGDGDVSLVDISRFMSAWTMQTSVYDFNSDGKMTFRDFAIILSDSFFK